MTETQRLAWTGDTGRSSTVPDGDRVRVLFETIGGLYALADDTGREYGNPGDAPAVEEVAGFLDDVKRALTNPSEGRAMLAAIARYEAVRNPIPADPEAAK